MTHNKSDSLFWVKEIYSIPHSRKSVLSAITKRLLFYRPCTGDILLCFVYQLYTKNSYVSFTSHIESQRTATPTTLASDDEKVTRLTVLSTASSHPPTPPPTPLVSARLLPPRKSLKHFEQTFQESLLSLQVFFFSSTLFDCHSSCLTECGLIW